MKKYLLLSLFALTGCGYSLHDIIELQNNPSTLFERKAEMEHGNFVGVLSGKKKMGSRFICYYDISGKDKINGMSMVKKECPAVTMITR